ncbi:unnamed protein product [Strongylus vulgaris]|uniref:Uncharacterized protein n=1 Tax=Strongylus vulgaris TaxID=40348 RepID=A0A3P7JX53_STRVU|nr:unnamed protein product [Strongylus vulgaris]
MFAMDERLAAAFKAMAPKKENKIAAHMASVFRLKLADLLLFTVSSQNTPLPSKVYMMIPLLKLAKQQLKHDVEGHNSRKTIGLLNIIAKLKKEVFVPKSKVFLKAGFNPEYRIFRRTEAILCLAGMMVKGVQHKVSVEKSTVKGIGKSCTEYFNASVAEPDARQLDYFAIKFFN